MVVILTLWVLVFRLVIFFVRFISKCPYALPVRIVYIWSWFVINLVSWEFFLKLVFVFSECQSLLGCFNSRLIIDLFIVKIHCLITTLGSRSVSQWTRYVGLPYYIMHTLFVLQGRIGTSGNLMIVVLGLGQSWTFVRALVGQILREGRLWCALIDSLKNWRGLQKLLFIGLLFTLILTVRCKTFATGLNWAYNIFNSLHRTVSLTSVFRIKILLKIFMVFIVILSRI
jgi:hypothetical protein